MFILPNIKSAKKRVLIAEKKSIRNKIYISSLKTAIKKAMDENNSNRNESINIALRLLDKSVSKGILHKNTAARKKSVLIAASK